MLFFFIFRVHPKKKDIGQKSMTHIKSVVDISKVKQKITVADLALRK